MDVQHPRATDVDGRDPPAKVSIPGHGNIAVEDGSLTDLDDGVATQAMRALGDAYDVAYTDNGDVVREADGPVADDSGSDVCGTEMSDGSTCERLADECPYHGED